MNNLILCSYLLIIGSLSIFEKFIKSSLKNILIMIPVEFSYFRTIFGKSGQGSYLSSLPGKCRELLSYLSIHFFMDKEEQCVARRLHPVFIPVGNTVIWELKSELNEENFNEQLSNGSTNTLFKTFNLLSINNIIKNIYLTYYAGEVEIGEEDPTNSFIVLQPGHSLMICTDSNFSSPHGWSYYDLVPEKTLDCSLKQNNEVLSGVVFHRKVAKTLRKRILIITTLHPGISAVLNKIIPSDCGIRAGPW